MIGFVYNTESMFLVARIHGNTNRDIEVAFAQRYNDDEYGLTYSPAFGTRDGVIDRSEVDDITLQLAVLSC